MTYRATLTDRSHPANDYTAAPAPSPALALDALRAELGIEAHSFRAQTLAEDLATFHAAVGDTLSLSFVAVN